MSQQEKDRYYTRQELEGMKFRKLGQDVLISRTSRIYIPEYVWIDDFSIVDDLSWSWKKDTWQNDPSATGSK